MAGMSHDAHETKQAASPPASQPKYAISAHEARVISAAAAVDPRTVIRFLRGGRVASTCRARIVAALLEHGLGHLIPKPTTEVGGG